MNSEQLTFRVDESHLTGILESASSSEHVVIVLHPHPLYGGDMYNPVVTSLAEVFRKCGLATFRFDFRGVVSRSEYAGIPGAVDDAIAAFTKIIEKDPKNAMAHKNLGVTYAQSGKLEDAISELEIAVKLKADSANLWNNLSEVYRRAKNFHQANVARMRAIQLNELPKNA